MSKTVVRRKHYDANGDDDGVRVICIGLPRTGTTSLKEALEILGFGPCHHMVELFRKPEQTVTFLRAYDGEKVDFYTLLKGYRSTLDIQTLQFYEEIHRAYPRAKLILTVRDSNDKWFTSYQSTIGRLVQDETYDWCVYPLRFLRLQSRLGHRAVQQWLLDYGSVSPTMHDQHNQRMIEENREKKLLIYNVKEGWKPLCQFLGVDEPQSVPFPNANDTKEFQSKIRLAKVLGLVTWLGISIVISVSFYMLKRLF